MIFLTVESKNFNPTETQNDNKEENRELHKFFECCSSSFCLKASKCTIKCYWYMANPSNENFQDWWDTSKVITCCAPTEVIVQVLQIENTPGGARTHFFPMPLALPLQTSSSVVLCQHGSLLCSIFMGSVPCCRASLALTSSL